MFKKSACVFVSILMIASLTGCTQYASERNFDLIAINMPKEEVVKKMDVPGVARGSIINKFGQVIEVREYKVDAGKSPHQKREEIGLTIGTLGLGAPIFLRGGDIIDTYWLYFCNGRLVQWGKAGDWSEAQKQVYDINFNIHKNPTS